MQPDDIPLIPVLTFDVSKANYRKLIASTGGTCMMKIGRPFMSCLGMHRPNDTRHATRNTPSRLHFNVLGPAWAAPGARAEYGVRTKHLALDSIGLFRSRSGAGQSSERRLF